MQQVSGVYRVTTPLPFRPREVHAYMVRLDGGGWLLVDGGGDTPEAWAALDAGVRAQAEWSEIRLHVITHMHMDHIGLATRATAASGAPLAMGRLDAERSTHAALHPDEEAEYRAELFRENGVPTEMLERIEQRRPGPPAEPLGVEYKLSGDGGQLPLAPEWQWIWTPGHTAGHAALFRPGDGAVIGGDVVLPRVSPTIGVNRQREDPVGDYLETLARLDALGVACILPGHGEPITLPADRILDARLATQQESRAVYSLLAAGPESAWEITRRRYPDRQLPPSAWVQALRETLAHLQHLAAAGQARRERDSEGWIRFSPA